MLTLTMIYLEQFESVRAVFAVALVTMSQSAVGVLPGNLLEAGRGVCVSGWSNTGFELLISNKALSHLLPWMV